VALFDDGRLLRELLPNGALAVLAYACHCCWLDLLLILQKSTILYGSAGSIKFLETTWIPFCNTWWT
jgi:hypothetical protein